MRSGKLRYQVAVYAPPNAETPQDVDGQPSDPWTLEATVPGEVIEGSANVAFVEDIHKTSRNVQVRLRYYSGLTEKHRFTVEGRDLTLVSVRHDAKKTETLVDCIEYVA